MIVVILRLRAIDGTVVEIHPKGCPCHGCGLPAQPARFQPNGYAPGCEPRYAVGQKSQVFRG